MIRPIKLRNLSRGLKQAAKQRLEAGEITQADADKMLRASRDNKVLRRLLRQMEEGPYGFSINWESIKDWIIENWPTILKVVLSLLVLLDERK